MKDTLVSALKLSGDILLSYFNLPLNTKQKESKSSIVTEADFASDQAITRLIKDRFPSHNIITEESGFTDNKSEYSWIVDPLDGTSNFASGLPWFGVLISLFKNNEPLMGGAYLPVSDTVYFAEQGKGAFKNDKPLTIRGNSGLSDSLMAFSVDFTDNDSFLDQGIGIYKYLVRNSRNVRSTNSLLDFLYVAEGRFGGCINLFTKVWDISALGLIVSEAGGFMIDIYGNEIVYSIDGNLTERNFPVVYGSRKIIESLKVVLPTLTGFTSLI